MPLIIVNFENEIITLIDNGLNIDHMKNSMFNNLI